jgi:adenosine deaminase
MNTAGPAPSPFLARPKALLHEHLDGGLRPQTLLDLCRAQSLPVPAEDASTLARWMHDNAHSGSLVRYLRGFDLTVAAMASPAACERVAFEAAEDARLDGCVLAEFRMAPLLLEPHGLAPELVIESLVAGLRRSALPSGLIVCAMRTTPPEDTLRAARVAARYVGQGVVGFDLAGAELGHPASSHGAALRHAADAGLGVTCHAGEADRGARVIEAGELGATRIGHGVHILLGADAGERARWVERARELGLHFEVCPSSNVHTGAVPSLAVHPIGAMADAGLSVSCSTDNRLMSSVTLSEELQSVHAECGVTAARLGAMMRNAVAASFLAEDVKRTAMEAVTAGWADVG